MNADNLLNKEAQKFPKEINEIEENALIECSRKIRELDFEDYPPLENDRIALLITPEVIFEKDELEFEREIKSLGKKEFIEFRKKFREFSSEFSHSSFENDKGTLRIISKKLHLIKREYEKREAIERIQFKIKEMLLAPEEALQMDEIDFKEAIHHMENKEFKSYAEEFQKLYYSALDERKKDPSRGMSSMLIDKQQRKLIKRWDLIEEEMIDRQKRTRTVLTD